MSVDLPEPFAEDRIFLDAVGYSMGILTPDWDVIAANSGWSEMFPGLDRGVNVIGWIATAPIARSVFPEWEPALEHFLAWWIDGLRRRGTTPRSREVTADCVQKCPQFEQARRRAGNPLYLDAMVHTPVRVANEPVQPWTFTLSVEIHPYEALRSPGAVQSGRLNLRGFPEFEP